MPNAITTAFVTEFQTVSALLLQQQDSRLRNAVTPYALNGEAAEILEQFGTSTAVTGLGRHADTPILDVPQDRRWCYPTDAEWGTMIDKQDKLRMLIDPQGPYTRVGVAALNRQIDDQIVTAIFGNANTGKTGGTITSLPSGQIIANTFGASAATGLNVAKLREARRLLKRAEVDVDAERPYCALSADKEADLLQEIQVIHADYNGNAPVLQDGRLMSYMGFDFIHSERFAGGAAYTGSTSGYEIPVWVKSGVGLGIWNDIEARVAEDPGKRFNWIVYMKLTCGATRLEEKRVVKIQAV